MLEPITNQPVEESKVVPIETPIEPTDEVDKDQAEWDTVEKEYYNQPEENKPTETTTETTTEPVQEDTSNPTAIAEMRISQREAEREVDIFKAGVRSVLLKDIPNQLTSSDGSSINSAQDLLQYIDPLTVDEENPTGSPFTPERATVAFLQMKQELNEKISQSEKYADSVARLNVNLKDEADLITKKYQDVFKAHPDLAQEAWAEYAKTLTVSGTQESPVIVAAPVSLTSFYNTIMKPYVNMMKMQEETAALKAESEKMARSQEHSDRSDIYSSGKDNGLDNEDKEWEQAFKEQYNN